MSFDGSRLLRLRWDQKQQAQRANRAWRFQDKSQAELRNRLDREAKRAGFRQPAVLVEQAPKPPA